jgi:outer membrane protein
LKGLLLSLTLVSSAALAEAKLAYVNAALLLDQAPQAQKAAVSMKEEFGPRENKLNTGKRELEEMQQRMARDGSIMSDSNRQQMRVDILSRQRELVRDEEALRQDISIRRSDVISGLQGLIRAAIDVVGKQGQYDIIFYDGIAYANPTMDITDKVLEQLKKTDSKTAK